MLLICTKKPNYYFTARDMTIKYTEYAHCPAWKTDVTDLKSSPTVRAGLRNQIIHSLI